MTLTTRRFASLASMLAVAGLASSVALAQPTGNAGGEPPKAPAKAPEAAKPAANLPPAKEILEKSITASGGRAAIEKLKNRTVTGTMEIPAQGIKGTLNLVQVAPAKAKLELDIPGLGKMEQGSDGTNVWESNPMAGSRLVEGDERDQYLRSSTMNAELFFEQNYPTIETLGVEDVAGKPAYKVRMKPKNGPESIGFFDQASGLMVKQTTTMKSPMGEIPSVTLIEDYRDVDGVKVPFKTRQQVMGMEQVIAFESVKHNTDVAADKFEPPADVKALLAKKEAKPADAKPGDKAPEAKKPEPKKPEGK
jgi:hypothetical protein